MEPCRLSDGARIQAIVKEHHQRTSPEAANWEWVAPTSRAFHLVGGEIDRIDLRFGQVVPPGYVALCFRLGEFWQGIEHVLLPRPRHHSAQMRTNLVRGAAWIPAVSASSVVVDPIQKLADVFAPELVKWNSSTPACPLPECCGVLLTRSLRWIA